MKTLKTALATTVAALAAAFIATPIFAAEPTPNDTATSPAGQAPDAEMMAKMMEMAKPGENQKLLGDRAGTWNYKLKFWMAPGAPPSESKGTAVTKSVFDGRYSLMNVTGKMEMPGADGKMKSMLFKGMSVDGYDNVKQKFVSSWIDNMGTGIMMSEGTYDPGTKTFTYQAEEEMMPGMKTKVREVVKIVDKDHHTFEFYEDRGGQETKTMEIDYTRQK
ncbi:MAG: DUF1579 domain-containing protein [Chthoniobacterales bacterium]|nr:DUF1579 domain-containing protein [Chthoniobacterales bacterium]